MSESSSSLRPFLLWFQAHHGFVDGSAIDISHLQGYGRGVVALKNIPEGHTIFTIPRSLTLSTRTSSLPSELGELWKEFRLSERWVGLILCMMWEEAQGASSMWCQYLESLPTSFDTPMFWNKDDLAELKGTSVVDSIGREDAEVDYREKLLPVVQARPDLFPPESVHLHYSIDQYHIMGSRILSRSFHVEKWESQVDGVDADENTEANTSAHSGMDVDEQPTVQASASDAEPRDSHEGDNEDSEDEEEDSSDVALVPMADMLNARYGSENAKLFYEENELKMISTKPIKAGEQIWNTYGDPPNADLLRRYGHVDLLPLPQGGEGNPGDVVYIRADLVVTAISQRNPNFSSESCKVRIDWWLENGGDDVFVLESDLELPEMLVSLVILLMLPDDKWHKVQDKGKPPKPKPDEQVLSVAIDVLVRRLGDYPTSIQIDEATLSTEGPQLSLNKKHAVIVRLGEKKILNATLGRLQNLLSEIGKGKTLKRKEGGETETGSRTKKSRR